MTTPSDADQLRRRNHELFILNAIAQALNSSVDLDQILETALAQVASLFDLQTGWIWLLGEDTGESYLAAAQNLPPALAREPTLMEGSCYCLRTYREGDLAGAANVNVVECSRLSGLVDGTDGLRYHSSIPLYAHGKKLGVLNVASTDWHGLSDDDLRLLHTVGDLLSITIERARLFAQSAQLGALEERNRLAREIHDTLAQGLTAVSLHLESADAMLESNVEPARVQKAVRRALTLVRSNLEEARRSVLDLRAAPLEDKTLIEAVTILADQAKVPVSLTFGGVQRPLSPRLEIGVYRIVQEALANIGRHARASRAELRLTVGPDELHLVVSDDGRGFDPDAVTAGHFGLIGLNERVRLLGGQVRLESAPGQGTRLEVRIPFNPQIPGI